MRQHSSYRKPQPLDIEDVVKSKLVKNKQGNTTSTNVYTALDNVSRGRASVATDAKAIRELLPDVKLVENLIIDSVLAPNDLTTIKPQFKLEDTRFNDSPVIGKITDLLDDHFTNSHKIVTRLKSYLKNILFDYGSQTMILMPESSIDEIINGQEKPSNENMSDIRESLKDMLEKNAGLLGKGLDTEEHVSFRNTESAGIESFLSPPSYSVKPVKSKMGYTVHDNPNLLKAPGLIAAARSVSIKEKLASVGIESTDGFGGFRTAFNGVVGYGGNSSLSGGLISNKDQAAVDAMYKNDNTGKVQEMVSVKPQSKLTRESVGHPIVLEPTADAVILAHLPDNPGSYIGGFVLLNDSGNSLSLGTEITRWNNVSSLYSGNTDSSSGTTDAEASIRNAYTKMYGHKNEENKSDIDALRRMYEEMVVDDLNHRLLDGVYGHTVELAAHENIFKVMLARHLSNMNTRLLWVPESLLTYMAVEWNKDGTGRALTEDVRIIASYRSIMMMATILGQINSSVNHTKLTIDFDEEDMTPQDTARTILEEYAMTKGNIPVTTVSFLDQYTFLQAAGVSIETNGNPNYPDTKVSVDHNQRNPVEPNTELNEMLRKLHLSAYGVTIEQLDAILTSDTATAVKAATANFTKSVQNIRHIFSGTGCMTDFIRKYVSNSRPLKNAIKEILIEHKDELPAELAHVIREEDGNIEMAINEIIRSIIFVLPDAVFHIDDAHIDAFEREMDLAEKIAEIHFNPSYMTEMGLGEVTSELVDSMRYSFVAAWMRDWLRKNGINNFDELIYGGPETSTLDKVHIQYLEAYSTLVRNMAGPMKDLRARNEKILQEETEDLDNFGGDAGGFDAGSSGGGSDDTFAFDDDTTDDSDSLVLEDETTEETETETETEEGGEDNLIP